VTTSAGGCQECEELVTDPVNLHVVGLGEPAVQVADPREQPRAEGAGRGHRGVGARGGALGRTERGVLSIRKGWALFRRWS
jgi:hypothetical protein